MAEWGRHQTAWIFEFAWVIFEFLRQIVVGKQNGYEKPTVNVDYERPVGDKWDMKARMYFNSTKRVVTSS